MIERKVVKALPSSFVASNMKLATDRGSGEAKLWVGQMSNAAELDAFFCFDSDYISLTISLMCRLDRFHCLFH